MVDLEYVKSNIKTGWMLNPNPKVVNGIINGINRCDGDCPCNNDAEEKHCPCSNYRLHDKCCCKLYLKDIVKVVNESDLELPKYETEGSAGMDLRYAGETRTLQPLERGLFSTGIRIQLPKGYEAQIRPRSGMALKKGISCANAIGTIDQDYIGIVGAILINLSNEPVTIEHGERIAQMVINKVEHVTLVPVETLDITERGDGGFGHTGTK